MSFTIRPAERQKIGLLFGIAAPSGAGKTFSALTLAEGIKGPNGQIAVIDTEAGRALHYAPQPGEKANPAAGTFDFLHLDFAPPFSPARYIEAIQAAEAAGATVIVIDSMSHEWDGIGGCADMATETGTSSWIKPKKLHRRMVDRLIRTQTHLIFCLRAYDKVKFEKVTDERTGRQKTEITPIGFMPVCEKAFMFELSASFMMDPENPGVPSYTMQRKLNAHMQSIFKEGHRITREHGERLRVWAETGAERAPVDKADEMTRLMIEEIQDAPTATDLETLRGEAKFSEKNAWLKRNRPDHARQVKDAVDAARAAFDEKE